MNSMVKTTDTSLAAIGNGRSVLGESQARIPTGGKNKIRSGIKVLTSTAKGNQKAQPIYDAGVAAGKPWAVIEKELVTQCGFDKSPLTPKNVAFFTVRPSDFIVPEIASAILAKYGSDGPDGFHLYRFPVIFPIDSWLGVMPHGLNCYTRSERVYWSEYSPDGTRMCMTRAPVQIDPRSKRAHRIFGGRQVIPRTDNGGVCIPDKCHEYQARKCNLSGSFLFYIPGIPGSSAFELPTTSFYSMQQARQKLEMVAYLRGGKISGMIDGKPIFYLSKRLHEVTMINPEDGKPKKVKQFLIELEADIDMTKVFQQGETRQMLEAGATAAVALETPTDFDDEPPEPPPDPMNSDHMKEAIKTERRNVLDKLNTLGIAAEHFAAYGSSKWGAEWGVTLDTLITAGDLLQQAANDMNVLNEIKTWNTGVL